MQCHLSCTNRAGPGVVDAVDSLCLADKYPFLIRLAGTDLSKLVSKRGFDGVVGDLGKPEKSSANSIITHGHFQKYLAFNPFNKSALLS